MGKHTAIDRWQVLKKVIDGKMTLSAASIELDVSYRQAVRIKKAVVEKGVRGLIHGNTGRKPRNALSEETRAKIIMLSKNGYAELNDTRFAEKLKREHNIGVSRETVRQVRRSGNIPPLKTRLRPRLTLGGVRPREGICMFWDCIINKWFPASDHACCLVAAIDDASGCCVSARFFPFEESAVYLRALKHVVKTCGIPRQIIQDKNPLLKRSDKDWSIEEQLSGKEEPTQIGKAMDALGIQPVFVNTRRQKRFFERIFEQMNIYLLEELQHQKIADINAGNRFLEESFIQRFNKQYALSIDAVENCWKKPVAECVAERICSFRYEGSVNGRTRINVGNVSIQISETDERPGIVRKDLEVRQLLDGSWRVYFEDRIIGRHLPTPLLEPLRTKVRPKRNTTRAPCSTWTYPSKEL